jgi:hypothetical protein
MGVGLKMQKPTETEYVVFPGGKQADDAMVGDLAATALGEAIIDGSCPKLQVVIMQGTTLTDVGFAAMVKGLGKCPLFRDLQAQSNRISDTGFQSLVDVFLSGGFERVERLNM